VSEGGDFASAEGLAAGERAGCGAFAGFPGDGRGPDVQFDDAGGAGAKQEVGEGSRSGAPGFEARLHLVEQIAEGQTGGPAARRLGERCDGERVSGDGFASLRAAEFHRGAGLRVGVFDGREGGGGVELADTFGRDGAVHGRFAMAEQRAAEAAAAEEIRVLLGDKQVVCRVGQQGGRRRGQRGVGHVEEIRLAEILKTVALGLGDELVEVNGLVDVAQFGMVEAGVRASLEAFDFGGQEDAVGIGRRRCVAQGGEQLAGAPDLAGRIRGAARVIKHHFAGGFAQAPAGVGVVAQVSDAVPRQVGAGQLKNLLARIGGDPGEKAVGNDVIESAETGADLAQVHPVDFDVGEAEGGDFSGCGGHGARGKFDAHEAAFGERPGHGDQVAAIAATQLEHAAAVGRRGLQAEEGGDGGKAVGVRLGIGEAGVGDLVVGVLCGAARPGHAISRR